MTPAGKNAPPRCGDARELGSKAGTWGQEAADSRDANAHAEHAQARAIALGVEVQPDGADKWLLLFAGKPIGTVTGAAALVAAIAGFEAAQRDVRELVRRIGSAA